MAGKTPFDVFRSAKCKALKTFSADDFFRTPMFPAATEAGTAFQAAAAQSPVTSWDHYDTIYTERYMSTPQDNKAGYEAGSAMKYAPGLKGRLMLYYGTADNNVHPNNMMQLIKALQTSGKNFEVQVGPDAGHSAMNGQRMMEFFIENLVMKGNMATI